MSIGKRKSPTKTSKQIGQIMMDELTELIKSEKNKRKNEAARPAYDLTEVVKPLKKATRTQVINFSRVRARPEISSKKGLTALRRKWKHTQSRKSRLRKMKMMNALHDLSFKADFGAF